MRLRKSFLLILIASALLLSAASPNPKPSPGPRKPEHRAEQGQTVQANPEAEHKPAAHTAFILSTPQAAIHQEQSGNLTAYKEEPLYVVLVKDAADYGLLVFSAALVGVGLLQAVWLKRTILANRPHVTWTAFARYDFRGQLEPVTMPYVTFDFRNLGESPAFLIQYSAELRYFKSGATPPVPEYTDKYVFPDGFLIPPKGNAGLNQRRNLKEGPLTPSMIRSLSSETGDGSELLFYGFIQYRDVFRFKHETRFSLKYMPQFNHFTHGGPRTYFRYT